MWRQKLRLIRTRTPFDMDCMRVRRFSLSLRGRHIDLMLCSEYMSPHSLQKISSNSLFIPLDQITLISNYILLLCFASQFCRFSTYSVLLTAAESADSRVVPTSVVAVPSDIRLPKSLPFLFKIISIDFF